MHPASSRSINPMPAGAAGPGISMINPALAALLLLLLLALPALGSPLAKEGREYGGGGVAPPGGSPACGATACGATAGAPPPYRDSAVYAPVGIWGSREGLAEPLSSPAALLGYTHRPGWGFQFGLGFQRLNVDVSSPDLEYTPAPPFSDGGALALDWLYGAYRVGYQRRIYRATPPEGTTFREAAINQLGFDADQLWAFHGHRPWPALYLGYGLGYQRRAMFFRYTSGDKAELSEYSTLAGLIVDYTVAEPFSLQARFTQESGGKKFQVAGESYFLTYLAPF